MSSEIRDILETAEGKLKAAFFQPTRVALGPHGPRLNAVYRFGSRKA